MNKTFSPETVATVRGGVDHKLRTLQRTPLHVDFSGATSKVPSTELNRRQEKSPTRFNAIGSRCVGSNFHLPLLDLDGGGTVRAVRGTTKAILRTVGVAGIHSPDSDMSELLADHGIDLEVFTRPVYDRRSVTRTKEAVSSIVLRSEAEIFDIVPSTREGSAHLYVQQPFNTGDHKLFIAGMNELGIIGNGWRSLAEREGMGVVRTPWTQKELDHYPS